MVGDLLGWAAGSAWNWPGTAPSDGRAELRSHVRALAVRGACIAAAGVVLGLWWGRRLVLAVSGAGVAVALVVVLTVYGLAAPDEPERPSWDDQPRGCVELSGEPSDCP